MLFKILENGYPEMGIEYTSSKNEKYCDNKLTNNVILIRL